MADEDDCPLCGLPIGTDTHASVMLGAMRMIGCPRVPSSFGPLLLSPGMLRAIAAVSPAPQPASVVAAERGEEEA
jgi:hypothetical protein